MGGGYHGVLCRGSSCSGDQSQECILVLKSDSVFIRVLITAEVGIRPGNLTREADIRVIKLKRLPLKSNQIMLLLSSLALSTLKRVEEISPKLNSCGSLPLSLGLLSKSRRLNMKSKQESFSLIETLQMLQIH